VQFLKDFTWGYNAIVCAQDDPDQVTATSEDISGSSATVTTIVSFGGSAAPGQIVTLTLGPTGWQISSIDCRF
jgi:hypothetical protein